MVLKKTRGVVCLAARSRRQQSKRSRALTADPARELDVLGHDGHPLGVDGAQVGVLEEAHEVGLGGL